MSTVKAVRADPTEKSVAPGALAREIEMRPLKNTPTTSAMYFRFIAFAKT